VQICDHSPRNGTEDVAFTLAAATSPKQHPEGTRVCDSCRKPVPIEKFSAHQAWHKGQETRKAKKKGKKADKNVGNVF
jgi:hypothetical protein